MQDLRPMSISEILDVTFRLYRERFTTFLTIALVVYLPFAAIAALVPLAIGPAVVQPTATPTPGTMPSINPGPMIAGGVGMLLLMLIFRPLCIAALTSNISAAYLGQKLSAAESYQRAVPRLLPLIGTFLLIGVIFGVMGAAVAVLFFVHPLVGTVALITMAVIGIMLTFWFYVVAPVVILEGSSGPVALRRSRELIRGNIGKAFGLSLILFLLGLIIGAILGAAISFVPGTHANAVLGAFVQNLVQALILPITTAPVVLFYYDLRIRKEAFDLQMLASAMEQPATT